MRRATRLAAQSMSRWRMLRWKMSRWKMSRWKSLSAAVVSVALTTWLAGAWMQAPPVTQHESYATLVANLSETGGFFDTDNLISNEKSYLQVIPQLERDGVSGGVYIGVGPDQNFSYIARIRPNIAFIVDIRRDNLLLHLLLKAVFAESHNRLEYLCLLTGRAAPSDLDQWRSASIDDIAAYVDSAKPAGTAALDRRLHETIRRFGVPVTDKDFANIDRFHATFVNKGLDLQFQSFGRSIQSYNPTFRELLLETDSRGRRASYLASEDDFQFLRTLQAQDRIVPVVGDFSGTHALAAVGDWMALHKEQLSAFYVSNVEDYLYRGATFGPYVENLKHLPHSSRAVVIRSIFGRFAASDAPPGYYMRSTTQRLDDLLAGYAAGKYRSYSDLVRD
jgi:hypothetical protein